MLEQTSGRERVTFDCQLPSDVLESMKSIAREEGRRLETVFEEAVAFYLKQRTQPHPRVHVIDALDRSIAERHGLYRELANEGLPHD